MTEPNPLPTIRLTEATESTSADAAASPDALNDDIVLIDDVVISTDEEELAPWNVLVVDDDEQVHAVTRMVLRNFRFRGRALRLVDVKSAQEARLAMQSGEHFALALIDVVMETKTAGLDLVRMIRDEYKNRSIRLILRTGQPGHAPEQDVVIDYEIDAYLAKTDISAQKLTTSIIASLRTYEYIVEIESLNAGLEHCVAQRTAQLVDSNRDMRQANTELGQAAETLRQLGEVGRHITANLEAEAVFDILYRHVGALLDAPVLSIYRTNASGTGLEFSFVREDGIALPDETIPLDSPTSNAARAARERRDVLIELAAGDDNPNHIAGTRPMLTMLFAPLIVDQRLLGVMSIQSDIEHAYGERELLIFRTLCAYVAIALDNASTYRQLQQTQVQLVAQEKLAALGSLVAGVAHELNTPLGNSLMMASALQDNIDQFNEKMHTPAMARTDLIAFMDDVQQASTLIQRGLSSAADLVNSFKQVAMDRTTAQRRVYDLQQTSHEIIATMINQIKIAGHRIVLDIEDGCSMNSYPGPYGQVISNFINNALLHGFEGREQGMMRLTARQFQPGWVRIEFQDDGAGIAEEDLKRIFDPFFTTKRGQGGNGLGLSISYNIVTSLLNGHIKVDSKPGVGTCFILELPLIAPLQQH
jgi:signal transduction histidine kinase/DNA-binding response OmpR family regulator